MRKYHLNPEQQQTLADIVQQLGIRLLAINFEDPATDEKMIRHHAYLRGKFDLAREILQDEDEAEAETNGQPLN